MLNQIMTSANGTTENKLEIIYIKTNEYKAISTEAEDIAMAI